MNNTYPQNQNFEQSDILKRKKNSKDLIIWWFIGGGLLVLYFLVGILEVYGNIYLPYESSLSTVLFGSGIIIGAIAFVKTLLFVGAGGKMVLVGGLILIILSAVIFYYRVYKPERESQLRAIQSLIELEDKQNAVNLKTYTNSRIDYSLSVPGDWVNALDEAYTEEADKLIQKSFIPGTRGVEISKYVFASDPGLLKCRDSGPEFDSCVDAVIASGAYMDISVTYRGEKSIDGVVLNDTKLFSTTSFVASPVSIAGKKTFIWNIENFCKSCSYMRTYIFNGKDNYTYQINQLVHIGKEEQSLDQKQAMVQKYQRELESILPAIIIGAP